ncbi:replicative DNA helicase,Replicative DNA helicase,replicative DNA helicase,Replicative DNA helicase,phage replicative helicase, DnaB family,DnaB-like helicase N terminal domain [[Clostridium] sordellii]|uniref:DnaB-like helicase N-terminal domain-containing protein n=1 Tax=Paraclostridium sordellii TaxID=1505 RepID=UPI000543E3DF|nr:DnaB-like helicase N-terminal domain-containing protein [Paeniclostridium sordellii]CEK34619.1 replicative DNA helicase,Replicative DNA helicase,replicative DNA helicase,Replicative DNA helicase,phage replicative helicase, DnaB family,DnaB-like helicase N terminal domain [[Clostridium] sordellii] [Paeniclostridium sordellii]
MEKLTNLQAEQSILGSLLLDPSLVYKLKEKSIKVSDFYYEYNKIILKVIRKLNQDNKPIDLITITEELKAIGKLEACGGISYITSLSTIVPTVSNIEYYIDIVRELSLKRNIDREIINISEDIEVMELSDIVNMMDKVKESLLNNKKVEDLYIDASTIKRDKGARRNLKTGFNKLDNYLGGLTYGTMTILTGEPSSGKSTILNQIIANTIQNNHKVFIYSGELPSYQLMEWFVRTVVNEYHLKEYENKQGEKYKDVTDYSWELVLEWVKDKFFVYGQDSKATENNLLMTIEYLHNKKGVRLFILDNMMTIQSEGSKDKYSKQEDMAINLKSLAKKYGLVIILVAHPNKGSSQNNEHSMYDVSGASEVVNLADHVIKTIRNKKDDEDKSFITILKNRTTGKQNIIFQTYFDNERKRFYIDCSELEKDYGYEPNKQFSQAEIQSPF